MKIRFSIIALLIFACSEKKYAPEKNFYFEVITQQDDESTLKIMDFINEEIPKKKYTITNTSGMVWPFYRELGLNEEIPGDSLMPPHWFVHKMIPLRKDHKMDRDEFIVKIF